MVKIFFFVVVFFFFFLDSISNICEYIIIGPCFYGIGVKK